MIIVLKSWFNRYFSDPQAVLLAILLLAGFTIVMNRNGQGQDGFVVFHVCL